jgi:hypothetical protein
MRIVKLSLRVSVRVAVGPPRMLEPRPHKEGRALPAQLTIPGEPEPSRMSGRSAAAAIVCRRETFGRQFPASMMSDDN